MNAPNHESSTNKIASLIVALIFFLIPSLLLFSCGNNNNPVKDDTTTYGMVNLETSVSGDSTESPFIITWSNGPRVLQIYKDGLLKYPINPLDEHKAVSSPETITLANAFYEVKLWVPDDSVSEKVVWLRVGSAITNISVQGVQFDSTWLTVPGDGCYPQIADYITRYAKYVQVDNSNPSYSVLVADGALLKADNGNLPQEDIIHNITYLQKLGFPTEMGKHVASYYFQIPSCSTGITVEGGLFVWLGNPAKRRDLGTAFQLIVNQADTNFGKIYYWGGSGVNWIYSGKKADMVNDYFYKVTFTVDIPNNQASLVFQDRNQSFTFDNIISETVKDTNWTTENVARFQAECISRNGKKHTINFKSFSWIHKL